MTEDGTYYKALPTAGHSSAVADHVISTGDNIKWDNFEILANGRSGLQCKIKKNIIDSELKSNIQCKRW